MRLFIGAFCAMLLTTATGCAGAEEAGEIDLSVIELRDQLVRHRLTLRAAEGVASGEAEINNSSAPSQETVSPPS